MSAESKVTLSEPIKMKTYINDEEYKPCNHKWQPIETAPKDGTIILFFIPFCEIVTSGVYEKAYNEWRSLMVPHATLNPPTHWMPLPEQPNE